MRLWLAIGILLAGVAAAYAIPGSQQIIMFGGQSAASNPPPLSCGTGVIDLSTGCTISLQSGLVP